MELWGFFHCKLYNELFFFTFKNGILQYNYIKYEYPWIIYGVWKLWKLYIVTVFYRYIDEHNAKKVLFGIM